MEALQERLIRATSAERGVRNSKFTPHFVSGALLIALALGCTPMGKLPSIVDDTPRPSANCCQAVVTWSNKVHLAPDTVNGGKPAPGIIGRLYLFGERIDYPLVGDGSIVVDLFNDAAPSPDGQPLERWQIDADTLHRLLRKDTIGWGYTLYLPWGSCRPDITRVHMTLRYEPRNGGNPLYAPSSGLTLEHPGPTSPTTVAAEPRRDIPPIGPPADPVPPVKQSRFLRQ